MKRLLDIFFSFTGLLILSPLFAAVALLIKLDSKGPVFYRQERVGKDFKPFRIYKFRSMRPGSDNKGPLVTVGGDKRITKIGALLRKYKIDELPQLLNVLKGDMSFVGPRPEVNKYVQLFNSDYKKLLKIRPGITDPASIHYSDEERVLSASRNWEEDYTKKVLPEKLKLSLHYMNNHNIITDIRLILKTIFKSHS